MRSHQIRCLQSRAAGMAASTHGRNTRFPSARELRAEWDEAEAQEAIEDGLEQFKAEREADTSEDDTSDVEPEPECTENRYCPKEKRSTSHKVRVADGMTTYTCEACGSVKFPVQFIRSVMR